MRLEFSAIKGVGKELTTPGDRGMRAIRRGKNRGKRNDL